MRMPETKCLRREPSWETRSPAVTVNNEENSLIGFFYLFVCLLGFCFHSPFHSFAFFFVLFSGPKFCSVVVLFFKS